VEWKGFRSKFRLSTLQIHLHLTNFRSRSNNCYNRFKSFKFLLTNSKVPRDTKKLVAGVGEKKANVRVKQQITGSSAQTKFVLQEPELVNGILKSIQSISDEARRVLADPELSRDSQLSAFSVSIHQLSCLRFRITNLSYTEIDGGKPPAPCYTGCLSSIVGNYQSKDSDAFWVEYKVNWGRRGRLCRHSDS
jgi:hypothetical protein